MNVFAKRLTVKFAAFAKADDTVPEQSSTIFRVQPGPTGPC